MALPPLNGLQAFVAVARRRSFSAAASALGLSPSALSQSVRQLEGRLGIPLLLRTSRSVSLTDAGKRLLENAGAALDQAQEALESAVAKPGEVTGRVRLSVPSMAVASILKPLLPRFWARFPHVEIDVRVENRLVNIVEEGLDAGIRLTESIERDMVQLRLSGPCRFIVVGAPSYLKRKGVPQKPDDLLSHECICIRSTSTGGLYAWELERGSKSWRIPVHGPLATDNDALMLAMAEAGVGLMYTFEPAVTPQLKRGTLRAVLEPYAASVPGLFLYFPSRSQVSPALRAFVDVARESIASFETGEN